MKTTVVHCKQKKYDIYIGRGSKWGNPFTVGSYGRTSSILKYKEWIERQPNLLKDIKELKGKVLGCWCRPLACHGDILAKLADNAK